MTDLNRRQFGKGRTATGTAASAPSILRARCSPSRTFDDTIPFDPVGKSDVTAHIQHPFFERITGQNVFIKSKTGAGGARGWAQINGFEPDGTR